MPLEIGQARLFAVSGGVSLKGGVQQKTRPDDSVPKTRVPPFASQRKPAFLAQVAHRRALQDSVWLAHYACNAFLSISLSGAPCGLLSTTCITPLHGGASVWYTAIRILNSMNIPKLSML
jgi:hypothetical protein